MKQLKLAFVHDNGSPQYLDGSMMQYQVEDGPYPFGKTLAFFDSLEHAQLFAKALASKTVLSDDNNYSEIKKKYTKS
jgi:hypothetical protein